MSQTILQYRSSSSAITPGVTTLAFGKIALTNIAGVTRLYIGNSSNVAIEVAGDAFAKLASPAFTGTPTVPTAAPGTNTTQAASTAFVTTAIQASAAGLVNKGSVNVATTAGLAAYTYNNGSSGVGATITANSNGAIGTIDGVSVTTGMKILVKNETSSNAPYNGIYDVTNAGDGSNPFVLTRSTNFDSSATIQPNSIVSIIAGTTNGDTMWWVSDLDAAPTVGTTDIVFTQFASPTVYTGGDGIDVTGSVISAVVDDSTIEINGSNEIAIKAAGVGINEINSAIAGNGLTGGSGSALSINADTTTSSSTVANAANVSSNGLAIKIDGSSVTQNGSNQLQVATVDGGTF